MKSLSATMFQSLFVLLLSISWTASADTHENFLQCLSLHSKNSTPISKVTYTPSNSSYSSILNFTIHNLRFETPYTPKPLVIVTPLDATHIQATINCSREHDMQIRIRSGGHDYEGLSFVSHVPFVVLDMINLRSINLDVGNNTAWVQAGATLGELYYKIAQTSRNLAFPAGVCPTVGVGGHFSGGGYGILLRKYGIAADHIIDATFIDVNGRILDRKSMGEDLFWAIRGGGGNSFGVVLAWRIRLVPVPTTVTVFRVQRTTLEQNVAKLVHRWQSIADKLHEDLFIMVSLASVNASQEGKKTIQASFHSLFLGGVNRLIPLMQESFPELGLKREDCIEMSWIESILFFHQLPTQNLDALLDRTPEDLVIFKAKSDYVKEPIPEFAWEGFWERLHEKEGEAALISMIPYGGKMSEISESAVPFPHRAGNICKILSLVSWSEEGIEASERHINWIRRLYDYVAPYVSKNPRAAYINYRDLDIGTNNQGYTSYKQASVWGTKYFKNNFDRLVHVKTMIDPANFFRNEQSIPHLTSWGKRGD